MGVASSRMIPAACSAASWPTRRGLDRRALWRIGSWGFAATGAVVLAVMANQSSLGLKRDQMAAVDLTRQAQQFQSVTRETHNEARRLAAAIDTLNSDRDRLYARVTGLEQGLESVTGAIARQGPARASPAAANELLAAQGPPAPAVAPVGTIHTGPVSDKPAANAVEPGPTVSSVARDAVKTDAAKAELVKIEGTKIEGTKTEIAKTEIAKPDNAKADIAKPDGAKPSPADAADGHAIDHGPARRCRCKTDRAEQIPERHRREPDPGGGGSGAIGR